MALHSFAFFTLMMRMVLHWQFLLLPLTSTFAQSMGFDDCGSARALPLGAHHLLVYFLGDIIVGNDTMLGAQVGVPHNCLQNLLLLGEKQRLVLYWYWIVCYHKADCVSLGHGVRAYVGTYSLASVVELSNANMVFPV